MVSQTFSDKLVDKLQSVGDKTIETLSAVVLCEGDTPSNDVLFVLRVSDFCRKWKNTNEPDQTKLVKVLVDQGLAPGTVSISNAVTRFSNKLYKFTAERLEKSYEDVTHRDVVATLFSLLWESGVELDERANQLKLIYQYAPWIGPIN